MSARCTHENHHWTTYELSRTKKKVNTYPILLGYNPRFRRTEICDVGIANEKVKPSNGSSV